MHRALPKATQSERGSCCLQLRAAVRARSPKKCVFSHASSATGDGALPMSGASFRSVEQSQEHIDAFFAAYNETAAPFAWTKKKVYRRRFKNRRLTQL
jgi:hypothetical protein